MATMMAPTAKPGTRIPLAEAAALAAEVAGLLRPYCTRLELAGSIRRQRPDVGDIELVAVPELEPGAPNLFGEPQGSVDLLDDAVRELVLGGSVWGVRLDANGRPALGQRYKRLTYRGFGLDLFSVIPGSGRQFGVLYLIRTGSAEFSHRVVTSRLLGGWLPPGHRVAFGAIWDGTRLLETPEEADVFRVLGAPYLEPERRTDTVTLLRVKGQERVWVDRQAALRDGGRA